MTLNRVELSLARTRDARWPTSLTWLNGGEQARLAGFSAASRRQTFLAGRWLLRELLASQRGGTPEDHWAEIDEHGRSQVEAGYANLSHSGDWCAAALAPCVVGIDIEVLRPRGDLMALAERVSGPGELADLVALNDDQRLELFYRIWTLKEAWLKARGQGLDLALMRELEFAPAAQGADSFCTLLATGLVIAVHAASSLRPSQQIADMTPSWQASRATRRS